MKQQQAVPLSVSFSRNNRYKAYWGADDTVRVSKVLPGRRTWRSVLLHTQGFLVKERPVAVLRNVFRTPIVCTTWSSDERLLLIGGSSGEVLGWDVPKNRLLLAVRSFPVGEPVVQVAFDPTNSFFAALTARYIQVWWLTQRSARQLIQVPVSWKKNAYLHWVSDIYMLTYGGKVIWSHGLPQVR